ncbi:uncharacterized protein LAJ45_10529 [Morchella importuna]|uniref:uncharacterized protein n=1 Tax=Morchella importuna TaxID=1174673 RepID=UPI001E8EC0C7|nr:uncharacterized protein LAJ45_10529 [Morchella importuna]KAH8145408.1 hypothetical protein LAJ45_10529 [Morchella importuna]
MSPSHGLYTRSISKESPEIVYSLYPFLAYTAVYFRDHLRDCNEDQSAEILLKLVQNRRLAIMTMQAHVNLHGPESGYYHGELVGSFYYQSTFEIIKPSLHLACSFGNRIVVRELIDSGYNVYGAGPASLLMSSPLHHAARFDHVAVVQFLLERGANINSFNWRNDTALDWAIDSNSRRAIQTLTDNGAGINAANPIERLLLNLADLQTYSTSTVDAYLIFQNIIEYTQDNT